MCTKNILGSPLILYNAKTATRAEADRAGLRLLPIVEHLLAA
jgi:hypothetical protein